MATRTPTHHQFKCARRARTPRETTYRRFQLRRQRDQLGRRSMRRRGGMSPSHTPPVQVRSHRQSPGRERTGGPRYFSHTTVPFSRTTVPRRYPSHTPPVQLRRPVRHLRSSAAGSDGRRRPLPTGGSTASGQFARLTITPTHHRFKSMAIATIPESGTDRHGTPEEVPQVNDSGEGRYTGRSETLTSGGVRRILPARFRGKSVTSTIVHAAARPVRSPSLVGSSPFVVSSPHLFLLSDRTRFSLGTRKYLMVAVVVAG